MSEFTIKIEDDIVQSYGKQTIEQWLQVFVVKNILKAAATDILNDEQGMDTSNDKAWVDAKRHAFLNDRYSQMVKINANV